MMEFLRTFLKFLKELIFLFLRVSTPSKLNLLAKKELIKLTKWLQNKGQQVLFSSFVRPENIEMFISEDIISDGHIIDITTREVAV